MSVSANTQSGCVAVITPFPRKDGFHIGGYGREDGQSDGEHESHAEGHEPDLGAGREVRKFSGEFSQQKEDIGEEVMRTQANT